LISPHYTKLVIREFHRKIGKEEKMKKLLKAGTFLAVMTLTLAPTLAPAFNPATHIYIADQLFPESPHKVDLYYGSTAPDIANFVTNVEHWPTAFRDTHYRFKDLRGSAIGPTQMAFANGWLTHNEKWGADYYAHTNYPTGEGWSGKGYVDEKIDELTDPEAFPSLPSDFAHYAIEVAIDYLLQNGENGDPNLAGKLWFANFLRSWQDRNLLARVIVWKHGRTDWLTLATAELTFRNLVGQYALALASGKEALVELAVQLAQETYGMQVEFHDVWLILNAAIGLCEGDYQGVIDSAIEGIKAELN
jgi:hypothetical protein